jgi:hypothetical protein
MFNILNSSQSKLLNTYSSSLGQGLNNLKNNLVGIDWIQRSVDLARHTAYLANRDAWLAMHEASQALSNVLYAMYQAEVASEKSKSAAQDAMDAEYMAWLASLQAQEAENAAQMAELQEKYIQETTQKTEQEKAVAEQKKASELSYQNNIQQDMNKNLDKQSLQIQKMQSNNDLDDNDDENINKKNNRVNAESILAFNENISDSPDKVNETDDNNKTGALAGDNNENLHLYNDFTGNHINNNETGQAVKSEIAKNQTYELITINNTDVSATNPPVVAIGNPKKLSGLYDNDNNDNINKINPSTRINKSNDITNAHSSGSITLLSTHNTEKSHENNNYKKDTSETKIVEISVVKKEIKKINEEAIPDKNAIKTSDREALLHENMAAQKAREAFKQSLTGKVSETDHLSNDKTVNTTRNNNDSYAASTFKQSETAKNTVKNAINTISEDRSYQLQQRINDGMDYDKISAIKTALNSTTKTSSTTNSNNNNISGIVKQAATKAANQTSTSSNNISKTVSTGNNTTKTTTNPYGGLADKLSSLKNKDANSKEEVNMKEIRQIEETIDRANKVDSSIKILKDSDKLITSRDEANDHNIKDKNDSEKSDIQTKTVSQPLTETIVNNTVKTKSNDTVNTQPYNGIESNKSSVEEFKNSEASEQQSNAEKNATNNTENNDIQPDNQENASNKIQSNNADELNPDKTGPNDTNRSIENNNGQNRQDGNDNGPNKPEGNNRGSNRPEGNDRGPNKPEGNDPKPDNKPSDQESPVIQDIKDKPKTIEAERPAQTLDKPDKENIENQNRHETPVNKNEQTNSNVEKSVSKETEVNETKKVQKIEAESANNNPDTSDDKSSDNKKLNDKKNDNTKSENKNENNKNNDLESLNNTNNKTFNDVDLDNSTASALSVFNDQMQSMLNTSANILNNQVEQFKIQKEFKVDNTNNLNINNNDGLVAKNHDFNKVSLNVNNQKASNNNNFSPEDHIELNETSEFNNTENINMTNNEEIKYVYKLQNDIDSDKLVEQNEKSYFELVNSGKGQTNYIQESTLKQTSESVSNNIQEQKTSTSKTQEIDQNIEIDNSKIKENEKSINEVQKEKTSNLKIKDDKDTEKDDTAQLIEYSLSVSSEAQRIEKDFLYIKDKAMQQKNNADIRSFNAELTKLDANLEMFNSKNRLDSYQSNIKDISTLSDFLTNVATILKESEELQKNKRKDIVCQIKTTTNKEDLETLKNKLETEELFADKSVSGYKNQQEDNNKPSDVDNPNVALAKADSKKEKIVKVVQETLKEKNVPVILSKDLQGYEEKISNIFGIDNVRIDKREGSRRTQEDRRAATQDINNDNRTSNDRRQTDRRSQDYSKALFIKSKEVIEFLS